MKSVPHALFAVVSNLQHSGISHDSRYRIHHLPSRRFSRNWPRNVCLSRTFYLILFLHSLSENPFQYDDNDLPLGSFCQAIARQLSEITAHPAPDPAEFTFTVWNQPFAPDDTRNAQAILDDGKHEYHHPTEGLNSVRRTMLRNWKSVHESTSKMKSEYSVSRACANVLQFRLA